MKSKILQLETEDGLLEDFYPITHCKCVMLNEETNLDDYLNEIIKCAPHKHSNKGILDKITKEYTKEKDEQLQSVINKTTKIKTNEILSVNNWYGDNAPYTYMVSVDNVSTDSNVSLMVTDGTEIEQYNAITTADITITSTGVGEGIIILTAFGTKPTIDIPITIVVNGKK